MTRITSTDHVLLLLRERLARADRGARAGAVSAPRPDASPVARLRAMAAFDALSDDDRRRAVVQGLLTEELGDAVGNDPVFQGVIDGVLRIILDLPGGTDLIDRAAATLKR